MDTSERQLLLADLESGRSALLEAVREMSEEEARRIPGDGGLSWIVSSIWLSPKITFSVKSPYRDRTTDP